MDDFREQINKIFDIFEDNNFELRLVGGCVRDSVLGLIPKDIDFCTNALPDDMIGIFKHNNINYIETGIQHGTITCIIDNNPFEITTLRKDIKTDGRHAVVEYTNNFEEDSSRRDFTCNALSMDRNGNIHDYYGGLKHIQQKKIVFVGEPRDRTQEDYLRVLRYFRFLSKFEWDSDKNYIRLFNDNTIHNGMMTLSSERVWSEFKTIMKTPMILNPMNECGLLKIFDIYFECTDDNKMYDWINVVSDGMCIEDFKKNMKPSSREVKCVEFINKYKNQNISDKLIHLLRSEGYPDDIIESLLIRSKKTFDFSQDIKVFPVNGNHMISMGYSGKQIGEQLKILKDLWYENDFSIDKKYYMVDFIGNKY